MLLQITNIQNSGPCLSLQPQRIGEAYLFLYRGSRYSHKRACMLSRTGNSMNRYKLLRASEKTLKPLQEQ